MSQNKLSRSNLDWTEELYQSYLKNPMEVEDSWRWFFQGLEQGLDQGFGKSQTTDLEKELKVCQLLSSYRDHGSLKAKLNPLGDNPDRGFPKLETLGISEEDLKKTFAISQILFSMPKPLDQVLSFLEQKYCQTLALQVAGCRPEVKNWFYKEFETKDFVLSHEEEQKAFENLSLAEGFESFVHFHFLGKKRFSLEGLDALIPMLDYLIEKGTALEMTDLVLGMSHRGRLNVLVNILKQDPAVLFAGFSGNFTSSFFDKSSLSWDVKYHLGFSSQRKTAYGNCDLYLGYNPSHLEAIGPVISGVTRAIQRKNKDTTRRKTTVPVLIHGDASFCGQGVVSETLQLAKLKGYTIGGAIHIILNNQVGFTTDPEDGRSSLFASDLAKSVKAPVLLVNADDVSACLEAMDMAMRFRYEFGTDIFIDLIGYRKYGHNEGDEPQFTQPLMSKKIKSQKSALKQYESYLLKKQTLQAQKVEEIYKKRDQFFEEAVKKSNTKKFVKEDYLGVSSIASAKKIAQTSISENHLAELFQVLSREPKNFELHPKLKKILTRRLKAVENNRLDWAICELAAYGSLIQDGFSVRLTGQDSKRGTFSHRHAVYYDYQTNETFTPLKELAQQQEKEFCIYNSPLSEMAVLGFEYGNSCLAPDFLTLWEAQFGDFVNGAQIIIDQFLSSGEYKWLQKSDLVLLLPHAYEGQGPEHSSAYLERFLQLCSNDNMRVCQFTKPSNFFHAIRRQKKEDRKPLILMTPKSLLRHPKMFSTKEELLDGKFQSLLGEVDFSHPREVENVILCSGKVYFDLKKALEEEPDKKKRTALFSLEQFYPFPEAELSPILNGFPCLSRLVWFQEEPKNRGAWFFIKDNLELLLEKLGQKLELSYEGRPDMAATAEGTEQAHKVIQKKILSKAIDKL